MSPGNIPAAHSSGIASGDPTLRRGPEPGASGAGDRVLMAAILLGALAARLFFVFRLPLTLQWSDPRDLDGMARQLYFHGTYSYWTARPPGYPTFIAGIYCLFGPHLLPLRIIEAVLSTGAVALVGLLGARLFGRRAGMLAMVLAAFHPLLAFMPSTQYTENISFVLLMLVLVTAYSAYEKGGVWRWALTGALLGAETLVRPNVIAFLPGFALGSALLLHHIRRRWIVPVIVTGLAFALAIAPWMIRGHQVFHRWYFISTGGGRQLWLGNNESATGDTRVSATIDAATTARMKASGDLIDQDRWLMADARRYMREHPVRAAQLYVRKMANIFALYPETSTHIYVNPASRIAQGLMSAVIFAGALLGLARLRAEPALWPMLLGSLTFVLATALAFSSMRYRLFVEPCLIFLAGVGWARLWPVAAGESLGARPAPIARVRP